MAVGAIDRLKEAAADDLKRVARERGEYRRRQAKLLGSPNKADQIKGARMSMERLQQEMQTDRRGLDDLLSKNS